MKTLIVVIFMCFAGIVAAQPTEVRVKPLKDYYYTGSLPLDFKKFFGETTRPDTPDFSKELMLVLLMPSTKRDAKLDFDRISMKAGQFIEVYCKVRYGKHKLTYASYPLSTCVIPRYAGITQIHFYNNRYMRPLATVMIE
jgi:hypothetical protein